MPDLVRVLDHQLSGISEMSELSMSADPGTFGSGSQDTTQQSWQGESVSDWRRGILPLRVEFTTLGAVTFYRGFFGFFSQYLCAGPPGTRSERGWGGNLGGDFCHPIRHTVYRLRRDSHTRARRNLDVCVSSSFP